MNKIIYICLIILMSACASQSKHTDKINVNPNEDVHSNSSGIISLIDTNAKPIKKTSSKQEKIPYDKRITIFLNDVLNIENLNLFYYDKYFNQTSEIEYIMRNAYNDSILSPFILKSKKNVSIALSYINWRLNKVGIHNAKEIKNIIQLKTKEEFARVFKIEFDNNEIFYILYYEEPDLEEPIIGNIYDKNRVTLIPDNNVWDKLE